MVVNNNEPTRKDRIIDLTIVSNCLKDRVLKWKVQKEVYLNTDHSLITFNIGIEEKEESVQRFDFKNTNWDEWKETCTEAIEEWIQSRRGNSDINEDYDSFVSMLHEKAEECIPKKQVCKHSKGWWNPELTKLSKDYKRAKRKYANRCDEANENRLNEVRRLFKEEEVRARNQYLEEMVKLMDPRKPGQFWKIVNKERKVIGKGVVQPICREDGSLAVNDEDIFK